MEKLVKDFEKLSKQEKISFLQKVLPPLIEDLMKDEKFKENLKKQIEPYLKNLPLPARMLIKSYFKL